MTDSAQTNQQGMMFNVVGQFAKDVSLECPVPFFALPKEKINIQLDVGVAVRALGQENMHETTVSVKVEAKLDNGQVCYISECDYAGVYEVSGLSEEQQAAVLSIDGAALVYPFARQVALNMVTEAGYQPPHLGAVNFQSIFTQAQEQKQKADA